MAQLHRRLRWLAYIDKGSLHINHKKRYCVCERTFVLRYRHVPFLLAISHSRCVRRRSVMDCVDLTIVTSRSRSLTLRFFVVIVVLDYYVQFGILLLGLRTQYLFKT